VKVPEAPPRTRIELALRKGAEELLPLEIYERCSGLWIEEANDEVKVICYPFEPETFLPRIECLGLPLLHVTSHAEKEKDYAALARAGFTPLRMRDLTILPPWRRTKRPGLKIVIEPGMAFGTGRHESTKLMLRFIRTLDLHGTHVVDLGCGSGLLAIYARLCGASRVLAVDNDPTATEAAIQNIALNRADKIEVLCAGIGEVNGTFGVALANLDFDTFSRHRDAVVGMVVPNGILAISGIEKQFAPRISALFGDLSLITHRRMGDWHGYVFGKRR
jgi:ribosomal protein L11 methyltransferase